MVSEEEVFLVVLVTNGTVAVTRVRIYFILFIFLVIIRHLVHSIWQPIKEFPRAQGFSYNPYLSKSQKNNTDRHHIRGGNTRITDSARHDGLHSRGEEVIHASLVAFCGWELHHDNFLYNTVLGRGTTMEVKESF